MSKSIAELRNDFLNLNILSEYKDILITEGFYDEYKLYGIPCRIIRNYSGCWCGYVSLSKNHQDYKNQDNIESIYDVHGGITFNKYWDIEGSIYNSYIWLGFDCAHSGDICPIKSYSSYRVQNHNDSVYRDIHYVKTEVDKLAKQVFDRSLIKKIKDVLKKL